MRKNAAPPADGSGLSFASLPDTPPFLPYTSSPVRCAPLRTEASHKQHDTTAIDSSSIIFILSSFYSHDNTTKKITFVPLLPTLHSMILLPPPYPPPAASMSPTIIDILLFLLRLRSLYEEERQKKQKNPLLPDSDYFLFLRAPLLPLPTSSTQKTSYEKKN